MKVNLKDGWELDCIVLRKDGEKVTFKYDPLEDKLVKIVEVKEEELKELFLCNHLSNETIKSSNKPSVDITVKTFQKVKTEKAAPEVNNNKPKELTQKDLEKIKQIKQLWMNKDMTGKQIAERVGVKQSMVYFWKYHTPKELVM